MTEPLIISLKFWSEFPSALEQIAHEQEARAAAKRSQFYEPLFRGLGDGRWALETTLERSVDADPNETLSTYYRRISRSKPAIESLTHQRWDEIPDWPEFNKLLQIASTNWIDWTLSDNHSIYQYLIYLRNHGFPSPLLDWTASPYIAAAFAFDAMDRNADNVAIWAWIRNRMQSFGSDAHLFVVGPYLRTHPRHYVQQSRYSLCVRLRSEPSSSDPLIDYEFLPHGQVLAASLSDDLRVKILIPASERKPALMNLDSMNLNPYSLYSSEESLIRTIARREMFFK